MPRPAPNHLLSLLAVLSTLAFSGCGAPDTPAAQTPTRKPQPARDSRPVASVSRPQQLAAHILRAASPDSLAALEALACRSDGEESEEVGAACELLWEQNLPLLIRYLHQHPTSCLRQAIISELGAGFIDAETRAQDLAEFRRESTQRATQLGLSPTEKTLVQQITAAVDPTVFD
ncbi:hypothetical protein [Hymenobacter sp. B81]|uniref:hypothetical protein n=1 Tax=Hymenobacter sp. B81 TaxID=3344878 RepID=UPI0037DDCC16